MKKEPLGFLYSKKMPNLDVFWSWKQATNSRYAWKNVIYRKMVPSFTIFLIVVIFFSEKFKPRVRNGIGWFECQKQGFDFGTRKDKVGIVKKKLKIQICQVGKINIIS